MPFEDSYPIDDIDIPWGKTPVEVRGLAPSREWHLTTDGGANLRGTCTSVLGLPATTCDLRAPAPHKPILHVHYELAAPHLTEATTPASWRTSLTQLLGPPTEETPETEQMRTERGSLLFRAFWQRPWHRISLLVYRASWPEGGAPTATLELEWRDVLTAAQPFMAAVQAQQAVLDAAVSFQSNPQLFELRDSQLEQGSPLDMSSESPTARLRLAHQALYHQGLYHQGLYHQGLYQTPMPLWTRLSDRQVALWSVAGDSGWALSTKWSTVLLPDSGGLGPTIDLVTLHPAKGGGSVALHVGELALYDAYKSPVLKQLATELERRAHVTVAYFESHDC